MQVFVTDYKQFDTLLSQYNNNKERVFVYITSKTDPKTLQSWCEGCQIAHPKILSKIQSTAPNSIILTCEIDRVNTIEWKYYEDHENVKLDCVPALYELGVFEENGKTFENYIPMDIKAGFFTVQEHEEMYLREE